MSNNYGGQAPSFGQISKVICRKHPRKQHIESVTAIYHDGREMRVSSGWESSWAKDTFVDAIEEWYGQGVTVIFD